MFVDPNQSIFPILKNPFNPSEVQLFEDAVKRQLKHLQQSYNQAQAKINKQIHSITSLNANKMAVEIIKLIEDILFKENLNRCVDYSKSIVNGYLSLQTFDLDTEFSVNYWKKEQKDRIPFFKDLIKFTSLVTNSRFTLNQILNYQNFSPFDFSDSDIIHLNEMLDFLLVKFAKKSQVKNTILPLEFFFTMRELHNYLNNVYTLCSQHINENQSIFQGIIKEIENYKKSNMSHSLENIDIFTDFILSDISRSILDAFDLFKVEVIDELALHYRLSLIHAALEKRTQFLNKVIKDLPNERINSFILKESLQRISPKITLIRQVIHLLYHTFQFENMIFQYMSTKRPVGGSDEQLQNYQALFKENFLYKHTALTNAWDQQAKDYKALSSRQTEEGLFLRINSKFSSLKKLISS